MAASPHGIEFHDDPILLRVWREDDAAAVYVACQDREIQRWLPDLPRPYTHDDARASCQELSASARTSSPSASTGRSLGRSGCGQPNTRPATSADLMTDSANVASQRVAVKVGSQR